MRICFATNNKNKLIEIKNKLGEAYDIISLFDLGHTEELSETHDTLEGNSLEKALFIHEKYQINCFADDTGLLVDALDGEPGVNSARYAGPGKSSEDNMNLLLEKLKGHANRKAKFNTIITLMINGKTHQFAGEVEGVITNERSGVNGFGYDPIFIPNGWKKTFAELDLEEKNKISHRSKAVEKLVDFLNKSDHK
ncbi:MAG: RdgB/HAM1 family non-canonical purine NTP pyrophosphatase [Cyclobacteriaceae bacterium]|nr:RdgB/HAM1 family non-canonical purine NTP pyrophosphatase [Cyclobacteriaceae bacterium]